MKTILGIAGFFAVLIAIAAIILLIIAVAKGKIKNVKWGWIVCVIALIFVGYCGYKHYLKSPITKEAAVAQEWMIYWDKTPEAVGFIPKLRSNGGDRVEIEKMGDILVFKQFYEHKGIAQQALFVGKKTAPLVYKGRWQQDAPAGGGDFFVRFTPDMKAASGWQDNGTNRAIPMQLFAKN